MNQEQPPRRGPGEAGAGVPASSTSPDRSPWNWLLLVPVVIVLVPPVFNHDGPRVAGMPFFYWYQLAAVPVGVLCTVLAYRAGRR